jgi:hypothetical protein
MMSLADTLRRHPELVSGSRRPPAEQVENWMLKRVQHDGWCEC